MSLQEKVLKPRGMWCADCEAAECVACVHRGLPTKRYLEDAVIYMPSKFKEKAREGSP